MCISRYWPDGPGRGQPAGHAAISNYCSSKRPVRKPRAFGQKETMPVGHDKTGERANWISFRPHASHTQQKHVLGDVPQWQVYPRWVVLAASRVPSLPRCGRQTAWICSTVVHLLPPANAGTEA